MRIAVKEVGKPLAVLESDLRYQTDTGKQYIGQGSLIECVPMGKDYKIYMGVDEDGLRRNLAQNFLFECNNRYFPIQKAVGTAVFFRRKTVNPFREIYDYEVDNLTDQDIAWIEQMLSEGYQTELRRRFKDYGKGAMIIEPIKDIEDFLSKCWPH